MITQCLPLHSSELMLEPCGKVFQHYNLFKGVCFGNRLLWTRNDVWKLVEPILIPNDNQTKGVIEHICHLEQKTNTLTPLLSKHIYSNSVYAYCHTYTSGISLLLDKNPISDIHCTNSVNACIYKEVQDEVTVPQFKDYMKEWIKHNSSINAMSPIGGNPLLNVVDTDFEIQTKEYGYLQRCEDLGFTFSNNYVGKFNFRNLKDSVNDISSMLEDTYIEVATGREQKDRLDRMLEEYFTPWKINIADKMSSNLEKISSFTTGELPLHKIRDQFRPQIQHADLFWVPRVKDIKGLQPYVNKNTVFIPEYSKEFATLVEYIQTLALTDICLVYKFEDLKIGILRPKVVTSKCRYFSNLDTTQNNPTLLYSTENDYMEELGSLIEDWILTTRPDALSEFDGVKVIKTFNEELFFHFFTERYDNEELMYYDLIAGSMCGRNMCNLQW